MKPVWLLDIDGVINANPYQKPTHVWPEGDWIETQVADSNGRKWPFMTAAPVIDFIQDVVWQDKAEVIWLTTWQNDAQKVAAEFRVPELAVVTNPMDKRHRVSWIHTWWKLQEALAIADWGRPIIWTDDDIGLEVRGFWKDRIRDKINSLLISPNGNEGLHPKHLARIEEFLKEENR